MQIKTTMRYHLALVRTIIKKFTNNAGEGVEKREPSYTVGGNGGFLKKYKWNYHRPCSPTPGHIFGENHNSTRYMHHDVHCCTIYNNKDM